MQLHRVLDHAPPRYPYPGARRKRLQSAAEHFITMETAYKAYAYRERASSDHEYI